MYIIDKVQLSYTKVTIVNKKIQCIAIEFYKKLKSN